VTARTAGRLAWSLWGVAMVLEVVGILLWVPNHAELVDRFGTSEDFYPHVFLVPGYATVGAVIAARRRNRVGWLFLAFALIAALMVFTGPYHDRGVVIAPGSLPAAALIGRLGGVGWPVSYLFLGLLLLVFPDGRLPSVRWRPAALMFLGSWTLLLLYGLFAPAMETPYGVAQTNPLAIEALGHPAAKAVGAGALLVWQVSLAVMALAPLQRFRRAGPVQRQQLKWFAFVVGGCFVSLLAAGALRAVLPIVAGALMAVAAAGVLVGIPVAVGVAILRYRLYDIDRLISRALVYATLTVILGLGYGGLVLALGQLFGRVGERTPAGRWPAPPWPWRRCSSRPATASKRWWIVASTAAVTTRRRPSRPSAPACATRSTSTPSQRSSSPSLIRPRSRPRSRFGFDPLHPVPRTYPTVRHGQLPGPTEPEIRASGRRQPGCPSVKAPQRRATSGVTPLGVARVVAGDLERAGERPSWWEPRSPTTPRVEGSGRTVLACPTPSHKRRQPSRHLSRPWPATFMHGRLRCRRPPGPGPAPGRRRPRQDRADTARIPRPGPR
jgi:hypothetical protein